MDNNHLKKLDLIQMNAFEKLDKLRAGALFMDMGTGKTKVAVDLVRSKVKYINEVIWIAPASLLSEENYIEEIKKWAKDIFGLFRFYTSEGISQSDVRFIEMINLASSKRVFCVIDESIKFKNMESKRTDRILRSYNLFDFRLILNGTPTTKSLVDLLPQINFISPNILKMDEAQFANQYLEYFEEGKNSWRRWSKPHNEKALIEKIRPYIFDAKLDLPVSINSEILEVKMNNMEKENYNSEKDIFFCTGNKIDFIKMAQKFQQIYTVAEDKYKRLYEILKKHDKAVIFVKYIKNVDYILDILGSSAQEYTGRRKSNIKDFECGKFKYLICTYGTGSFGLNLQFCSTIVFFDQTFDYKDKIQAIHRVYRTGQKKNVDMYDFYVNVGLESIIRNSLNRKENLLKNLVELINKKGVEAL